MNIGLTKEDTIELQQHTQNDINNKHSNKHNPAGQLKDAAEVYQRTVFLSFDLFTKIIGFGNGSNIVTTVAYKIKFHPAHSTLLKSLLIKSSVLEPIPPSESNIHFKPPPPPVLSSI